VSRIFIHFLGTRWKIFPFSVRPTEQWAQGRFLSPRPLTPIIIVAMMWYCLWPPELTSPNGKSTWQINWATNRADNENILVSVGQTNSHWLYLLLFIVWKWQIYHANFVGICLCVCFEAG